MTKIRTCARKALGKGAGFRRSAPLELMAHGGPAADPQVSADLSTVRVWHRRILASSSPSGLAGCQPSEAGPAMASGSHGMKRPFVPSGILLRFCSGSVCRSGAHQT
eukprot:2604756-Amphidinium_carterae.1